jgi:hypothetical protein
VPSERHQQFACFRTVCFSFRWHCFTCNVHPDSSHTHFNPISIAELFFRFEAGDRLTLPFCRLFCCCCCFLSLFRREVKIGVVPVCFAAAFVAVAVSMLLFFFFFFRGYDFVGR